jgi:hypothetical protein
MRTDKGTFRSFLNRAAFCGLNLIIGDANWTCRKLGPLSPICKPNSGPVMMDKSWHSLFRTAPLLLFLTIVGALGQSSCNGGNGAPPPTIASVMVSPPTASLLVKAPQQFTANVQGTGAFNPAVIWLVNNIAGGNSMVGTITSSGVYNAPSSVPSPNNVTVTAQSAQDSTKSGAATVTINPEIVQISVSPASASLQLSSTQQFQATVTGTVNQSFYWTINGQSLVAATPWGRLDPTGFYTAPSMLPANSTVTLTATSLEDQTKSASATVTLLATAGGIAVTISPQDPQVLFDGSQSVQFAANVSGTNNTAVNWSVDNINGYNPGSITTAGVFTPLTFDCSNVVPSAVVHAVSAANPGAQGVTTISLVPPAPVVTGISPQPASVESTIRLSGTFAPAAALELIFPGPSGTSIVALATQNTGNTATASVPTGSGSGTFSIQQNCSSPSSGVQYPASQSNTVNFQRLPQLRLRAGRKDLSSGESLQLQAAFLGDSSPHTVAWGNGISSSGLYTAPSQIAPDTFVNLSACIANTTACDSFVIRLNPVRIDPEVPTLPAGGTLQLSALSGGATVAPAWSILAGGGNILSSGLYTAPTALEDTGPVLVTASYSGFTGRSSVGVTGAVPGIVNRVFDYPDSSAPVSVFDGTRSFTADGTRAYVLSASTLSFNQEYCWIDAYDVSDPAHPVWLDATEALKSEISPYQCSGRLLAYGGFLFEVIPDAGTAAGVTSRIAEFQFQNNHLTMQQLWSVPLIGAYYSFNPALLFNQGVFYELSDNLFPFPPPIPGTIPVVVLDVRSGNLVQNLISLPLPQPTAPAAYHIPVAMGNFMYAFIDQTGTATSPQYKLATYDISVNPPKLLGLADTMVGAAPSSGPGNPQFFGTFLSDGWDLYDISGGLPVRAGTLPFNIDAVNPNRSLAISGDLVVDISVPTASNVKSFLYDGVNVGFPFTWVGDYAYRIEGRWGLGIYSPLSPGGQLPLGTIPNPGGTVFDQIVSGNILYVAQQGNFSGVLVHDLSGAPPALVGRYSESGQDPFSIALLKNNLLVGTAQGLLVLDVSNPSSPTKVATLATPTSSMAISGNLLYLGTMDNRLVVLDVSNPAAPIQVAQSSLPGFPNILRASGSLLLIADDAAGLLTYGISNPTQPVLLSQYQPSSATEDVAIDGNLALIAATDGGLIVADLKNPAAPTLLGQARIDSLSCFFDCLNPAALSVSIYGGIAYVGTTGTAYAEVFGFDYRLPANPRLVSLMTYGGALDDAVLDFAFYQSEMFSGGTLFALADISQPRNTINLFYPGFPSGSGMPSANAPAKRVMFLPRKVKAMKAKLSSTHSQLE